MRTAIAGGLAAVVLVLAALVWAPPIAAQAGDRIVAPGLQWPALPVPGAQLGVSVRELRAEERARLGAASGGVVIESVRDDSPAEEAGLRAGDIVVEFDGERVRGVRHFSRLVVETPPELEVRSIIVRDGARQTVAVTPESSNRLASLLPRIERQVERGLRALPRDFDFDFDAPPAMSRAQLGITVLPLGDQLASYFGAERGALVSVVEADSPAARAGVRAGDVITSVAGRAVEDPGDVVAGVRAAEPGSTIEIGLVRDKTAVTVQATLPDREAPPV